MRRKCSIYIRNKNVPSSYYRIVQYLDNLECECKVHSLLTDAEFKNNMGIKNVVLKKLYQLWLLVKIYYKAKAYLQNDIEEKIDCVYVERTIIPRVHFKVIDNLLSKLLQGAKLIWDFDDNIIASGEISASTAKMLEDNARHIIVTHDYLKQTLSRKNWGKVSLLPTTDNDIPQQFNDEKFEDRLKTYNKIINIVWVGTAGNLQFIKKILPYLDSAAAELRKINKTLQLSVVCNQPVGYKAKTLLINNLKWTREVAIEEIYRAHIGIMPLDDNEYTRGKGAFKLLQYMAVGLPVVASPVGFNIDVVKDSFGYLADTEQEWTDAILQLSTNKDIWCKQSKVARDRFMQYYNPAKNIELLSKLIVGQ